MLMSDSVIVFVSVNRERRIVHLYDLNSSTYISYFEEGASGLVDITEENGERHIVHNESIVLDGYSLDCKEFWANPNGQNLKIFCKNSSTSNFLVYTVVKAHQELCKDNFS